jgi:hypothetical protein
MAEIKQAEQKREKRLGDWHDAQNIQFKSSETKKAYQERVSRFIKVFNLEKPDRVPVVLPAGTFPVYYAGMTLKEAMQDSEKLCQAYRKFLNDFESDTFASPMMIPSAKASEGIDTLTLKWPGQGLPSSIYSAQHGRSGPFCGLSADSVHSRDGQ